tara:strand:+ start:2092 stop:2352 length:261 start_codon:yes stop_codon:yes gene_type:complete
MKLVRQFDVFEKTRDEIFDEIEIDNFDLETVKGFIDNSESDPLLYNSYKIEGEIKLYFEKLGYKFSTEKHEYFLCCYQDNRELKFK